MQRDAVIVGGGVAGLVTAWRAGQRGLSVAVVDSSSPGRASTVAAGMLTPVSELAYGEENLLRLGLTARARYPAFIAELEELTGRDTAYRRNGILHVAFDSDDLAALDVLRRFQESQEVRSDQLTGPRCRELEPVLAPTVRGGFLAPDDGAVDPRRLTAALRVALARLGGALVDDRVTRVIVENDQAVGVRLAGGDEIRAGQVVLAAGSWTREIDGLPPTAVPPVRPVKGQVVRLRAHQPFLSRCLRGAIRGSSVYVIPRTDGEVVVGATQEEMGYDTTVTVGGVWELLAAVRELLPGVTELELTEVNAGLRPGTPDDAPLLGPSALPGLSLATGHFRNGILLAPVTGDVMAEVLATGQLPEWAGPFSPRRFDGAETGAEAGAEPGAEEAHDEDRR